MFEHNNIALRPLICLYRLENFGAYTNTITREPVIINPGLNLRDKLAHIGFNAIPQSNNEIQLEHFLAYYETIKLGNFIQNDYDGYIHLLHKLTILLVIIKMHPSDFNRYFSQTLRKLKLGTISYGTPILMIENALDALNINEIYQIRFFLFSYDAHMYTVTGINNIATRNVLSYVKNELIKHSNQVPFEWANDLNIYAIKDKYPSLDIYNIYVSIGIKLAIEYTEAVDNSIKNQINLKFKYVLSHLILIIHKNLTNQEEGKILSCIFSNKFESLKISHDHFSKKTTTLNSSQANNVVIAKEFFSELKRKTFLSCAIDFLVDKQSNMPGEVDLYLIGVDLQNKIQPFIQMLESNNFPESKRKFLNKCVKIIYSYRRYQIITLAQKLIDNFGAEDNDIIRINQTTTKEQLFADFTKKIQKLLDAADNIESIQDQDLRSEFNSYDKLLLTSNNIKQKINIIKDAISEEFERISELFEISSVLPESMQPRYDVLSNILLKIKNLLEINFTNNVSIDSQVSMIKSFIKRFYILQFEYKKLDEAHRQSNNFRIQETTAQQAANPRGSTGRQESCRLN